MTSPAKTFLDKVWAQHVIANIGGDLELLQKAAN